MADNVTQVWAIQTDNKVLLSGLQDDAGTIIADATVTGVLKDEAGNAVGNATNLTFVAVTETPGDYQTTIPYNADLLADRTYTLEITAVKLDEINGNMRAFLKMTRDAAFVTV